MSFSKRKVVLFIGATVASIWLLQFLHFPDSEISVAEGDKDLLLILNSLAPTSSPPIIGKDRRAMEEAQERTKRSASERLRDGATNYLPKLMDELFAIEKMETENPKLSNIKAYQVGVAFQVLGERATPVIPILRAELESGRHIGASVVALYNIGTTSAGIALASQLTNINKKVRNSAIAVMSPFSRDREVCDLALPHLYSILRIDSEYSRILAARAIGAIGRGDEALTNLMEAVKKDSAPGVRLYAIESISLFGTNASSALSLIKEVARTDTHPKVQEVALAAAAAIEGKSNSDRENGSPH